MQDGPTDQMKEIEIKHLYKVLASNLLIGTWETTLLGMCFILTVLTGYSLESRVVIPYVILLSKIRIMA